ncbi:MAG TPA: protein kinase [Bryobacteraceae bacterium]|jgi:serine/threonine-protein kinase|nr:protein kinase [Bryobacteraceae bacterium]
MSTTCDWLPKKIGKYEVEYELGKGGFGRVFRAKDPDVNRLVAVKILSVSNDSGLNIRFRDEAEAAGNLHHKNVITIYEYGESEGIPYIAMEYLEGETLAEVIRKGSAVPLARRVRILAEAAEGLQFAHEQGVVHRDVTPANILVLPDGGVKILDFGIARLAQQASQETAPAEHLVGTLRYMSPEQFDGQEGDALSDLFAFGIICYEVVDGQHPFDAEDAPAVMYKIRHEDPETPRDLPKGNARAIERLLRKALAKEREERYPTLEELRLDMEPILVDLEQQRAETLLAQAEDLVTEDRLDEAKLLLREALHLDGANHHARQLRMRIREYEKAQTLKLKINATVRQGEDHLSHQRFDEAVRAFQSALDCDPHDEDLKMRLERALVRRDRAKRLAQLKTDARQARERGDMTACLQHVSDALRVEPGDPEARELLAETRHAVAELESRKRQTEAIDRARGLLLLDQIDAALATLSEVTGDHLPEFDQVFSEIKTRQADRERRQRLNDEMAGIRNLLGFFRFDEALPWLESLVKEWPDEEEPRKLQAYAQQEFERQQKATAIRRHQQHAKVLLAARDYAQAIKVLEEASQQFPEDASLLHLLSTATDQKNAADRERAIREAVVRIEKLRKEGNIPEAAHLAQRSVQEYRNVPALEELGRNLTRELELHQRREAIRKAVESARDLIGQGRASSAVSLLRRISIQDPENEEVSSLLASAEESLSENRRIRAVEKIEAEFHTLEEGGEHAGALKLLEDSLTQFPGEERLLRLQHSAIAAAKSRETEQAMQRGLRQCERFRQEGRLADALELIDKLIGEYGEKTQLRATRTQLLLEIERQRVTAEEIPEINSMLANAVQLENEGKFPAALQILELATLRYPDSAELARAEERVRGKISGAAQTKQIALIKMEIEIYLRGRQFEQARTVLDAAERDFPGEICWATLRARLTPGLSTNF